MIGCTWHSTECNIDVHMESCVLLYGLVYIMGKRCRMYAAQHDAERVCGVYIQEQMILVSHGSCVVAMGSLLLTMHMEIYMCISKM